jgi:hypothetical protein
LTISATKEQILDGEKKTYKPFGIKVRGRKIYLMGNLVTLN